MIFNKAKDDAMCSIPSELGSPYGLRTSNNGICVQHLHMGRTHNGSVELHTPPLDTPGYSNYTNFTQIGFQGTQAPISGTFEIESTPFNPHMSSHSDISSSMTSIPSILSQENLSQVKNNNDQVQIHGLSRKRSLTGNQYENISKIRRQEPYVGSVGLVERDELGVFIKEDKLHPIPEWSELKTKAGKERKRLPLACVTCRRRKIRCSGEEPSCKQCFRSKIPCIYKVATRKVAPRAELVATAEKRPKPSKEEIIDTLSGEAAANTAPDVNVTSLFRQHRASPPCSFDFKKCYYDDENQQELEIWSRSPFSGHAKIKEESSQILVALETEEIWLMSEGADTLPSKDIQEHLADIFFENIEGQVYNLLHKPTFMSDLRRNAIAPVLVLAVCAVSARFSTHPQINTIPNFLRGEEWAAKSRSIVMRRYEWPNITILTCLLILSLHEFGTCQGGRSWSLSGMAIRMAYALQLHRGINHDQKNLEDVSEPDFIGPETRKRVMWACFLMDRFNSSSKDKPAFIREDTISQDLPIKEQNFLLNIPGITEGLYERRLSPIPSENCGPIDARSNIGISAYLIRAAALWGRMNQCVNLANDPQSNNSSPVLDSFNRLAEEADEFASTFPDRLKLTPENFRVFKSKNLAKQFLSLHIFVQQNILFINRIILSGQRKSHQPTVSATLVDQTSCKMFRAADKISELLRTDESQFLTAPFIGYCAFLAGTIHIDGIISRDSSRKISSRLNLSTSVKHLVKIKNYWGVFDWMNETLKKKYRDCIDTYGSGYGPDQNSIDFIYYGDWFDQYPHGIINPENIDLSNIKATSQCGESFKKGLERMDQKQASDGHKSDINIAILESNKKIKKSPPAPLITNLIPELCMQIGQDINIVSPICNQISPVTPINIYHQATPFNQGYLCPPDQRVLVPQQDDQFYRNFGGIDESLCSQNLMENPTWNMQINGHGIVSYPVSSTGHWDSYTGSPVNFEQQNLSPTYGILPNIS
ncbi:zinc finger transcription factor 1 [Blumeria hordei DH14]|uniref:Zinc finger transcription factor 1 n=1 Tax=Blumeria graminis f. sp. hordei (strain DH14) TaxID=546991 RepID=N1JKA6_BLUG1|nr:zinc finger transcription factor 1 [Blumeria hordei DH14]